MSEKEVADLFISATARIEFYWNFFVVIVTAIVGWLISQKGPVSRPLSALLTVAYVIAAGMNLLGLFSTYTLAEAVRLDLLAMTKNTTLQHTRSILDTYSYTSQKYIAIGIHFVMAVFVLGVINANGKKKTR